MFTAAADFSKMSSSGAGKLKVDDIKHKSFVDVNEKGTEATGVTGKDDGLRTVLFEYLFLSEIKSTVDISQVPSWSLCPP